MLANDLLLKAYRLMCRARHMAETYENNRQVCRYVHSTSRGHEAIQLAAAFNLLPIDFVSPYYRDDSLLLGLGFTPGELMLQLLAKGSDIFTGGREYYCHPNYKGTDKPTIIHQSSATGMQVIPATGIAQGIQYLATIQSSLYRTDSAGNRPLVLCSLGDASMTEGEVSEALQVSVLKKLPIIYLVQDNNWGISVTSSEARVMDAVQYAKGFPGLKGLRINGSDFEDCYSGVQAAVEAVRNLEGPYLIQANVPLLGHHTSGVRKEFYRSAEDLENESQRDPAVLLRNALVERHITGEELTAIEREEYEYVQSEFKKASAAPEPDPANAGKYIFVDTPLKEEKGERVPSGAEKVLMVDAALLAIREIMQDCPEAIFYGQDVGRRLGGVFREAATLAAQFGDHRIFNTAIQEAYIIGSTVGMSAAGVKPIVEVQFADYIYPGFNQLVTEVAKSCYLSCGKFPVGTVIRVPTGAYGGGGPYHSASIETTLLSIKGIKIVYPSNAADMKGLMKAAFYDPNPVVILEHKGLYWSKLPGTEEAKRPEPSRDYIVPLGKANVIQYADERSIEGGSSCCIITYGMGVYWSLEASKKFAGQVEIIDLRSLYPLDEELLFHHVQLHGKCLIVTEEQQTNSFAEALSGRIMKVCFQHLDAPVDVIGSMDVPAIPMNILLEKEVIPSASKVADRIQELLRF